MNKKGKCKQEKNEASYKKKKEASNKGNTHINNLYRPNLQCLLGHIRPRRPRKVTGSPCDDSALGLQSPLSGHGHSHVTSLNFGK